MGEKLHGRVMRISPARRLAADYLAQARDVPLVALAREFHIPEVVRARRQRVPSISWVPIFSKAFALAAQSNVNLRWNWIKYPFARIYEHPVSECAVIVEREWAGEWVILAAKIRAPETMPLAEFDRHVRRFRDAPVREISDFRQLLRLAAAPKLLRWFTFWSSLHWSGAKRCKRFGTFMVSSLGNFGTETLTPIMPLTAYLTFGPITDDGRVTVGLIFDHRVMDGRHAARALQDMERLLNTEILDELAALGSPVETTAPRQV